MDFNVNALIQLVEEGTIRGDRKFLNSIDFGGPEKWMHFQLLCPDVLGPWWFVLQSTNEYSNSNGMTIYGIPQRKLFKLTWLSQRLYWENQDAANSQAKAQRSAELTDGLLAHYRKRHAELDAIIRAYDG